MKIKNGKAKLETGEVRFGNYFIKEEAEHMKVTDINAVMTFRVRKAVPVGAFLLQTVEAARGTDEDYSRGMENYLTVLFSSLCTIPDQQFLGEIYAAAEACMKRHPEAYGMPKEEEMTEEAQIAAEKEGKELLEFEEQLKNLPDDAS